MGNSAANPDQSNTRQGDIQVIANETLIRSRLGVLDNDSGTAELRLPDAVTDLALYVINEAGSSGDTVSASPITSGENFRVRLNGTVNPGVAVVLCDPAASSGANAGKVESLPATAGVYFSPGIAEEVGVDEQLLLVRPCPRLIIVAPEVTDQTTNGTAGAASADLAALAAETELIGDTLRELLTDLETAGIITLA